MTPEQHLARADRITSAMRKLSSSDYEMVIEAVMLAGTHLLNAALHRRAISDADVMHAEYMSMALRTRTRLTMPGLVESLDEIEQLRPFFVRGNAQDGESAAKRSLVLLADLRAFALSGISTCATRAQR